MKEKRDLIRIVKDPDGKVSIDPTGRKNGRGVYLCSDKSCLEKAVKSRALERSLGCRVDREVYDELERCLDGQ